MDIYVYIKLVISLCMSMKINKPQLFSKKVISCIDNIYCWYIVNKCNLLLGVPTPKPSCNNQKIYFTNICPFLIKIYNTTKIFLWCKCLLILKILPAEDLTFNFGDMVTLLNIFRGPLGGSNITACGLEIGYWDSWPHLLSLCSLASI